MEYNELRIEDLYWVAGFLEGEGSFCRCGGTIQVSASQVEKDPIDRLSKLFNGNVLYAERDHSINPTWSNYYRWCVYGENAELIMKAIFPIMSPKRKNKISELLSWYASLPGKNFAKSGRKTCRSGRHSWVEENLGTKYNGGRFCRLCDRETKNNWQKIKRAELKLQKVNVLP